MNVKLTRIAVSVVAEVHKVLHNASYAAHRFITEAALEVTNLVRKLHLRALESAAESAAAVIGKSYAQRTSAIQFAEDAADEARAASLAATEAYNQTVLDQEARHEAVVDAQRAIYDAHRVEQEKVQAVTF